MRTAPIWRNRIWSIWTAIFPPPIWINRSANRPISHRILCPIQFITTWVSRPHSSNPLGMHRRRRIWWVHRNSSSSQAHRRAISIPHINIRRQIWTLPIRRWSMRCTTIVRLRCDRAIPISMAHVHSAPASRRVKTFSSVWITCSRCDRNRWPYRSYHHDNRLHAKAYDRWLFWTMDRQPTISIITRRPIRIRKRQCSLD